MFCLLTNERFNHDQNFDHLDSDLRLIQLQKSRIGALEGAQQLPRGVQLLLCSRPKLHGENDEHMRISWGFHVIYSVLFIFFSSRNSDFTKE